MTRGAVPALAAVVILAAAAGCAAAPGGARVSVTTVAGGPPVTTPAYPVGLTRYPAGRRDPAPDVAGPTLDGRTASLAALRGRVVVVNVWASWCPPCREESPALASLARRSPAVFLGVDERDTVSAATAFATTAGAAYPHLVDDGTVLRRLGPWLPQALPGTLVVDRRGRVAARVVGAVTAAQLAPVLAEVAAEPATATSAP